jgi:hypothetical protein
MANNYDLTVEEVIANTLKENLGSSLFKNYLVGRIDSPTVNRSMMPCLLVSRLGSSGKQQSTATDVNTYTVTVTIILDRRAGFLGVHGEEANSLLMNNLMDGIDPVTKEYSEQSILGILRKNFSLVGVIDNELYNVNYPITRLRDTVTTMEAVLRLTVDKHVVVTGRS